MAFSGGTFSRTFDCTTDRDNGVKILASKFDTELDGMATGLSTCILKDGTQTCTAAIPFAQGITLPDDKTIAFGTNSDVLIQYDETTTDSLKISAAEGAGLAITLMADEGDDAGDEWKLNIADGGTLTLGNDINSAGTYVTHLTITPNATVANSTMAVAGNLTVGGALTLGSGAVISEAELETIDGITPGTVLASKAMVVDSDKDITGGRNLTITGELDAATLDISGNADIDGTLEADAMTLNGSAITTVATLSTGISNGNLPVFTSGAADNDFLRIDGTAIEGRSAAEVLSDIAAAPAAGSSNIVTTGALNSGSITSGFGSIDNGSSAITTTGTITSGTVDVKGSSGATLKLTSTDTTGADTELLGQIDFVSSDSSGGSAGTQARIKGVYEDNGDSSGIAFLAGASTGSGSPTIAEVMRIRHEGNVGIGTPTPATKAEIYGTAAANNLALRVTNTAADGYSTIQLGDSNAGVYRNGSAQSSYGGASSLNILTVSGHPITLGTSNTVRLTIDPSGNTTFMNTFSATVANGPFVYIGATGSINIGTTLTSAKAVMGFRNPNGEVGQIVTNGSATAYNTSSDYRLKTAVTYDWDATSRLKKLKPARFAWIADGDDAVPVDGFLAHEVQDVVPEAISGTKDAMMDEEYEVSAATGDIYTPAVAATYDEDGIELTAATDEVIHSTDVERPDELTEGQQWRETTAAVMGTRSVPDLQGIDQSKVVPLLTKALIESVAKIEALEARIAALEAG